MHRRICTGNNRPAQAAINNTTRSSTPSLAERPGNIPRFYRAMAVQNGGSNTAASQENVQQQQQEPVPPVPTLEETRRNALHTLALCRAIIATLEVARIYKSRVGSAYWFVFWEKLYRPSLARALGSRVSQGMSKINTLFRTVSVDLHNLTQRMEHAVRGTGSEQEILMLLEHLEDEVGVCRRRRRKRAANILDKMRASIETIPVNVSDDLFDELKRGVFALDVFCDYHPGDPARELMDRTGSTWLVNQPDAFTFDPELYWRWLAGTGGGNLPGRVPVGADERPFEAHP